MATEKSVPNLNQNVWVLVVFLGALGAAEYWHLSVLEWTALPAAAFCVGCVICSTFWNTRHYCRRKAHQLRMVGIVRPRPSA